MTLAPEAQVVLISAVIGNAPVIAEWLIGDANAVISGEELLPTTSIAFASWQRERGLLQYVSPDDPEQQEFFVPLIVTQTNLAMRRGERAPRIFPKRSGTGASAEIGLYLGLHLPRAAASRCSAEPRKRCHFTMWAGSSNLRSCGRIAATA